MSRETVRMVREGIRLPVVVGDEPDRDELLARMLMTNPKSLLDALKAAGYDTGRSNRMVTRRGLWRDD